MKKEVKIIIISVITLLLITMLTIIFKNPIKLNKGNVTIEYKEKYKEPGFSAKKLGKDLKSKVKVSDNINNKKLGNYKVTYKLNYNHINYKKERKVKVKDTKKRKYYAITEKGKKQLKEKKEEWKIFSNGINKVIGGVSFAN